MIVVVPDNTIAQNEAARIGRLLEDYPQMDFGDATLVVLSEAYPNAKLVTLDVRDFTFYRRSDGRAVPIIAPTLNHPDRL